MAATHQPRSHYYSGLEGEAKRRYDQKLLLVGGIDPYTLSKAEWSKNTDDFPSVSFPDLVSYLLFTRSAYTGDELRSYKGLEAYNQFVSGWVREVWVKHLETTGRTILSAQVTTQINCI